MSMTIVKRFERKFIPEPNCGCWLWTGAISSSGYGSFAITSKNVITAHRASFLIYKGVPDNFVCHSCDNKLCVNPEHLWDGTPKENSVDASKKGILNKRPKRYGVGSKLKSEEVIRIFKDNRKYGEIAKEYNLSWSTIGAIKRGENWSYVTGKQHAPKKRSRCDSANNKVARQQREPNANCKGSA